MPTTRERILNAALALFKARGYHAAGVADILALAKAPKGSLYHHFPGGKPDLASAAVRSLTGRIVALFEEDVVGDLSPEEHLSLLCERCCQWLVETEFYEGVILSTLAMGLGEPESEVMETLLHSNREIVDRYAAYLESRGIESPYQLALTVLMTLEGAVIYARIRRDVAPFRACKATLAPLFEMARREGGEERHLVLNRIG
ncbi:TetR/AcrR family transcriptional regulator [Notoacmeibacter ruber]|nr:TetR/AcrR family transcriptional regulator [Notoacmeibacter ruber]